MPNLEQPNIILLVLDTVRARELEIYGSERQTMPELSEFAQEATVFERAYTNAPWTLPAHASLFTGQLPSEHGCYGADPKFEPDVETIPEKLSSNGYETYAVSNNIWISDHFGFDKGFDVFYKQWQLFRESRDLGHIMKRVSSDRKDLQTVKEFMKGNPVTNILDAFYGKFLYRRHDFGAKRSVADSISLLSNATDPYFLFVNFMEAHAPYMPREEAKEFLGDAEDIDLDRYSELSTQGKHYHLGDLEVSDHDFEVLRAMYNAELRYLDRQIGQFFDKLDSKGLFEDTMVVIVGDHGENIGDHNLMEHRFSLADTLLHVPLIIQYPDGYEPNHISPENPIDFRDLAAEISSVAGEELSNIDNSPVIAEYLDTTYTPESKEPDLPFEGSVYDKQLLSAISKYNKVVFSDRGEVSAYELNTGEEFERDGEEINPETPKAKELLRYLEFDPDKDQTPNEDIDESIKGHLESLGYM